MSPHIHLLSILLGTPVHLFIHEQILLSIISIIFWRTWGFFRHPISGPHCVLSLSAKLVLKHRTSMALAGERVSNMLEVTIPANSTGHLIKCFYKSHQVWEHPTVYTSSVFPQKIDLPVNITMHNSSCSGEYYFEYMNEKVYWVVRVQGE